MPTRRLVDDAIYENFRSVAKELGYKERGEHSMWRLLERMLAYAKEHPHIFRR